MKTLRNIIIAGLAIMAAIACKPEDPAADPASISITLESVTTESISFKLAPENAVSYAYACVPAAEASTASFISVEGGEEASFTVDGLIPETEYVILANATNADGLVCDNVSETVTTSTRPLVQVEVLSYTAHEVSFKVTPVNAVSYKYGVLAAADAETGELSESVDGSEGGEYTVDGLESLTSYVVAAEAVGSDGSLSERVFKSFKTEQDPIVEVAGIQTDMTSATVSLKYTGVAAVNYAVTEKGAEAPAEFERKAVQGTEPSKLYFYNLEQNTEYVLHVYGENRNGYAGETVEQDFSTTDAVDSDHSVVITSVTSFDAEFDVQWDTEKYGKCYWIAGTPDEIGDPDSFDWQASIDNYSAKTIWNPGVNYLNRFSPEAGEMYRVGFVFADKEGNVVIESAIWKDIQLLEITFGESPCSVEIENTALSCTQINYKINNTGDAAGFYFGYQMKSLVQDVESYAKDLTRMAMRTDFDTEVYLRNLVPEVDYVLVAVPVDADGVYGQYVSMELTTPEISLTDGTADMEVEFSDSDFVTLYYDLQFDENTDRVVWLNYTGGEYWYVDEQSVIDQMINYGRIVEESMTVSVAVNLNEKNNVWFLAQDRQGRYSDLTKFESSPKEFAFTGTGSVDISVDGLAEEEGSSRKQVKFTMTPDDNVDYYYYRVSDQWSIENDDMTFATQFIMAPEGTYPETYGVHQEAGSDGSGVWISGEELYIVIMPIDKNGNPCPLIRFRQAIE